MIGLVLRSVAGSALAVRLDALAFVIYYRLNQGVIRRSGGDGLRAGHDGCVRLFMLARAFVAPGSIAAPVVLHPGWNAVMQVVFSAGPPGAMRLVAENGAAKIQPVPDPKRTPG